jgi:hypothetical protein
MQLSAAQDNMTIFVGSYRTLVLEEISKGHTEDVLRLASEIIRNEPDFSGAEMIARMRDSVTDLAQMCKRVVVHCNAPSQIKAGWDPDYVSSYIQFSCPVCHSINFISDKMELQTNKIGCDLNG